MCKTKFLNLGFRLRRLPRLLPTATCLGNFSLVFLWPVGILVRVKSASAFSIVLVTAPDLKVARAVAQRALREKLVACANIIPKIESHYWWQGKIESGAEALIVFKTAKRKLAAFEKFVLANHPYDTPEFVVLPMSLGTKRYLNWIAASVE